MILVELYSSSLLHSSEDTSTLHNTLCSSITPFDVDRVPLQEDGNGLPTDHKVPILSLDSAVELAVNRVILEHIDHVV